MQLDLDQAVAQMMLGIASMGIGYFVVILGLYSSFIQSLAAVSIFLFLGGVIVAVVNGSFVVLRLRQRMIVDLGSQV